MISKKLLKSKKNNTNIFREKNNLKWLNVLSNSSDLQQQNEILKLTGNIKQKKDQH